jgi:hypothetical protein
MPRPKGPKTIAFQVRIPEEDYKTLKDAGIKGKSAEGFTLCSAKS